MTNFEIQKYYQNVPRFNGLYSWDNLPKKIKDEAYVMSLDEYPDVGTHWIVFYCENDETVYFNSLGVEHVPKAIEKLS